ncbi:MAG: hypothetical protein ACUVTZ_00175 [Armatimonadota bacterium]
MARRSPLDIWNDTKHPLLVILFAYIAGISVGSAQTWLESLVAPWVLAAVGAVLLLVVAVVGVPQWLVRVVSEWRSRETTRAVLIESPDEPRRGIIVFASMGRGIQSAKAAIQYYLGKGSLERCWIMTGGEESLRQAKCMVADLLQQPECPLDPPTFEFKRMTKEDIGNPERVRETVEEIYSSLPENWAESDVVADYTGGTTSVTAGMVLACASPRRNLQYMKPLKLDEHGQAVPEAGSVPVLVNINYAVKPAKPKRRS